MDIVITTSDPHNVSANEIIDLITGGDYWVNSIVIQDREGRVDSRIGVPL